jgi:tetratricopeptide (TPR) repeat protein
MRWGPAPVDEAFRFIDAVPQDVRTSARLRSFLNVFSASLKAMAGRFEEARADVERARATTDDLGLELAGATQRMDAGHVALLASDLDAAEQAYRAGYERLGELGETGYRSTMGAGLAEVLLAQHRHGEAARIVAEVEQVAQEDDMDPQARTRAVRALLLSGRGEHADAERLAREAVALYAATDYLEDHADMLVTLARVLRTSGQDEEARGALNEALALYERKGHLVGAKPARDLLSELVAS